MNVSLAHQTALVTGISSGIGREIALLLAHRGARVFGTARDPHSASPIANVEVVRMDVTDDASVNEAAQSVLEKAGPVAFLVNNAGYTLTGALEETSIEEAKEQFETNFFGALRVTNAVLPGMRQSGHGRIVNISSVLGFMPAPYGGCTPQANTRWKDTPKRSITRSGDSGCVRYSSNRRIRKAEYPETPNRQKSLSTFMRPNERARRRYRRIVSRLETIRESWRKRFAKP